MRHTPLLFSVASLAFLLSLFLPKTVKASFTAPESLKPITAQELRSLISQTQSSAPIPTPNQGTSSTKGKTSEKNERITIVNFWATWCEPCKKEMPELLKLVSQYDNGAVRLILVSADSSTSLPEAERFLKELGADLPNYYLGEPPVEFGKKFDSDWVSVLPMTFLFDSSGSKRATVIGMIDFKDFATKLPPPAPGLASKEKIGFDQESRSKKSTDKSTEKSTEMSTKKKGSK